MRKPRECTECKSRRVKMARAKGGKKVAWCYNCGVQLPLYRKRRVA